MRSDKKILIWFRKIKSFFVHVKTTVFGIERLDLCLLNKTKSFGFKKVPGLFWRTRKNWFLVCIKKKSDLFCNKKIRFVQS